MNSLTLGFLYVVGFGWALCETCLIAGTGNWLPLIAFFTFFLVAFSIMGCLNVSDRFMNGFGSLTAIVLGFSLLVFGIQGFEIGFGVGLLKTIGAIAFVVVGLLTLIPAKKEQQH